MIVSRLFVVVDHTAIYRERHLLGARTSASGGRLVRPPSVSEAIRSGGTPGPRRRRSEEEAGTRGTSEREMRGMYPLL